MIKSPAFLGCVRELSPLDQGVVRGLSPLDQGAVRSLSWVCQGGGDNKSKTTTDLNVLEYSAKLVRTRV